MRKVKMWRYYCEFCGKGGCSGGHIKNHEAHCTLNPNRECGICDTTGDNTKEMSVLLEALDYDVQNFEEYVNGKIPITHLTEVANECYACILAALRQYCIDNPDDYACNFASDYRKARDIF